VDEGQEHQVNVWQEEVARIWLCGSLVTPAAEAASADHPTCLIGHLVGLGDCDSLSCLCDGLCYDFCYDSCHGLHGYDCVNDFDFCYGYGNDCDLLILVLLDLYPCLCHDHGPSPCLDPCLSICSSLQAPM
jgi:hypothetical protein